MRKLQPVKLQVLPAGFLFFLGVFFFFAHSAKADTLLASQLDKTGPSSFNSTNETFYQDSRYPFATSTGVVSEIDIWYNNVDNDSTAFLTETCDQSANGGSNTQTINSQTQNLLSGANQTPFFFATSGAPNTICNLGAGDKLVSFTVQTNRLYYGVSSSDVFAGGYASASTTLDLYFNVYSSNNTLSIGFANPPQGNGFASPPFNNWWLTESIPTTHSAGITGYYFGVTYGTSSPVGVGSSSLLNSIGVIPLAASSSVSDSPLLATGMASTTPTGSYEAQATMYDQTGATITQSSILDFTITGNGSTLLNVANNNSTGTSTPLSCGATSFQLFGIDLGEAICNTAQYLFVPGQSTLTQWTNTQSLMQSRAPFSYFYELDTDLTSLPTSTTATMTPLDITIGATGTPINFTYDAFSANTIDKYTNPTVRALLRTIIEYALYLAFISMVIFEIRKIFSKPKQ